MRSVTACFIFVMAAFLMVSACAGPSTKRSSALDQSRSQSDENAGSNGEESQTLSDEEAALLDPDFFEEEDQPVVSVADPLEDFNRAMFFFNDKLYFWVLKPVALGYQAVMPQPARSGVKNFFYNLGAPIRIVNNILQGKGRRAEAEMARFVFNSTVGILGFGNPAKQYPALNPRPEDMGQTLGRYGLGNGIFLMLPGLGPTTLRDAVGLVGDHFLGPSTYYVENWRWSLGLLGFQAVNSVSLSINDYETLMNAALDPYQALRNGYIQRQDARIRD